MEDISSQEMDRPEENGRNRPTMIQKLERHSAVDTDRQNLDFMKKIQAIFQISASRTNLNDQSRAPHDAQESHKRAMEFVDTSETPDLDADSEEFAGGGHGRSRRQISGQSKINPFH